MARPAMRLRLAPMFPAKVQATDGLEVTRTGGVLTVGQDWTPIQESDLPGDPSEYDILFFDRGAASYSRVPADQMITPGADWSTLPGKPSTFPPSTHSHPTSAIIGLDDALAGKLDDTQATASGLAMLGAVSAAAQTALLSAFTGDSGAGGVKGLVPAPASGDDGAGKFLSAGGTWEPPPGSPGVLYDAVLEGGCDNTGGSVTGAGVQAAIDAATTAGRPCYFPPGTYDITGTRIRPPSGARIVGAGYLLSVFKRTTNTNIGTVECFGVSDVEIRGIGINYTAATYTLGYAQTGFCARNGSKNIRFIDCGVTGRMNRGFHVLNSRDCRLIRCYTLGNGNAAYREVCDFAASGVAGMSDETSPMQNSNNVVEFCTFDGAEADGSTTQYTSYGINLAGESGASDQINRSRIVGCITRNFDLQGIEVGGKCFDVKVSNCHAFNCGDSGGGIGMIFQLYSGNGPFGCSFDQCTSLACGYGFMVFSSNYCNVTNCHARSAAYDGVYVRDTAATNFSGTVSVSNGGDGWDIDTSSYCTFAGVQGSGNTGVGFRATVACSDNALHTGVFLSNTAGAYAIAWTAPSGTNNRS